MIKGSALHLPYRDPFVSSGMVCEIPGTGGTGFSPVGMEVGLHPCSLHASGSFRSIFILFEREKQPAIFDKIIPREETIFLSPLETKGGVGQHGTTEAQWQDPSRSQEKSGITGPTAVKPRRGLRGKGTPGALPARPPQGPREEGGIIISSSRKRLPRVPGREREPRSSSVKAPHRSQERPDHKFIPRQAASGSKGREGLPEIRPRQGPRRVKREGRVL
jgi:hypothetical protein